MLGRNGLALAFCLILSAGTAFGFSDAELQQYQVFVTAHAQEVSLRGGAVSSTSTNIFYLGADEREWEQIDAILDLYFGGLTAENQNERLGQLKTVLQIYGVLIRPTNPIGLYHISRDEVYVDTSLFRHDANANFTKSIIYHEKIHQNQNRTFDRDILKVDQRQKYAEKIEEIAAHYLQLRFVIETADPEAVQLTLRNSNRWNMFPGILATYPQDDVAVKVIREFMFSLGS